MAEIDNKIKQTTKKKHLKSDLKLWKKSEWYLNNTAATST